MNIFQRNENNKKYYFLFDMIINNLFIHTENIYIMNNYDMK